MKLTYWSCEHLNDSQAYAIRTKTKREAVERRNEENSEGYELYGPPTKIVMEYDDAFDMMSGCLSEDTGICLISNYKGVY